MLLAIAMMGHHADADQNALPYLCRPHTVRGFAIGFASRGIGTTRAFQVSEQAGAFATLAMGLNALSTAVMLPWLLPWLAELLS